jgi:hypothetical protein
MTTLMTYWMEEERRRAELESAPCGIVSEDRQWGVVDTYSHGEDVGDVVHHHVHPGQLGPDLGEDADMCAIDHVRLEQLPVGDIGILTFELNHVFDVFVFADDEGSIGISFAVNKGQDSMAVLPSILACQPTG